MACDAFVGIGSNLGDRLANLAAAVRSLRRIPGFMVTGVSPAYRTSPVLDRPSGRQPEFLNAAVRARTGMSAPGLVRALLASERALGRRRSARGGRQPRTVDLDLLLLGDSVSSRRAAVVPHPRLHARAFALRPVTDLARDARHPVLAASLRSLLAGIPPGQRVTRLPAAAQRRFRRLSRGRA